MYFELKGAGKMIRIWLSYRFRPLATRRVQQIYITVILMLYVHNNGNRIK